MVFLGLKLWRMRMRIQMSLGEEVGVDSAPHLFLIHFHSPVPYLPYLHYTTPFWYPLRVAPHWIPLRTYAAEHLVDFVSSSSAGRNRARLNRNHPRPPTPL